MPQDSQLHTYHISCDYCRKKLDMTTENRENMVKILSSLGWMIRSGQFRCPKCVNRIIKHERIR